jgi:hypothetical protein
MSSVPLFTRLIGTNKQCPFPGAYIIVGGVGANGMVPVYTSMPFFGDSGNALTEFLNDKDAQVIVLPGYRFELFPNALYNGAFATFDNSGGTDILYRNASLSASSCKLFYRFSSGLAEIPTKLINTVTLSSSPSATTSEVSYNGITYRLYSFTESTYTLSLTDTAGVGVDCLCLLIGGGGGGGGTSADAGQPAGGGGGGAGALVTSFLKLTPGYTFTISVGSGGVGGTPFTIVGAGNPSSIKRALGGVEDASLIAGGGGGGGGFGVNETIRTFRGVYNVDPGGSSSGCYSGYGQKPNAYTPTILYKVNGTLGVFNNIFAYGQAGGNCPNENAGGSGGGGAGAAGANNSRPHGGAGGAGVTWGVNSITYAGGGGGGSNSDNPAFNIYSSAVGGSGGGGTGGYSSRTYPDNTTYYVRQTAGTVNTGSGGGGALSRSGFDEGAAGGSGICIIAVPVYRLA